MNTPFFTQLFRASVAPGYVRLALVAVITACLALLAAPQTARAQTLKTALSDQTVVCAGTAEIILTASADHPNKPLAAQWQTLTNGNWVNVTAGVTTTSVNQNGRVSTTTQLKIVNYSDKQAFRVAFGIGSVNPATATVITNTTLIIPAADFTLPATSLLANNNISLTFAGSVSSSQLVKYEWLITDGTTVAAVANPVVNFSIPGEKTITLKVTDGGCIVSTSKTVRVYGEYTWNGSQSVDWYNPANWTPTLVPGTNDDVIIRTAPFPPVLSANSSIKNLTLNAETLELGSATLTVAGNATLNGGNINGGTVAFTGNVMVAGNAPVNISNAALIGAAPQIIGKTGNGTPVFQNLSVSKISSTATLETNLTVNGTLELNNSNKLLLGNSDLLIAPTGKIVAGTAGYVVTNGLGTLQMTVPNTEKEVFFPVGNHSYNPVKIKQNTSGTTDIFKIRVKGGLFVLYDADNNGIDPAVEDGVSRTWVIEEMVPGNSPAQVTLQFSADNLPKDWAPSFDPQKAVMAQFTESWAASPAGSASADPSNSKLLEVSLDNVDTFRIFGVFNYDHQRLTTLPVELISFKGVRGKSDVTLHWQTALEKNNDFYTLEMSVDGKKFSELTKVKGVGNTNQIQNYRYQHKNAPTQVIYYRLKQTDLDGTFTYAKVISVNGLAPLGNLVAYPNPGTGLFAVSGAANVTQAVVLDATGRIIKHLSVVTKDFTFDLSDEQAGIYFLRLTTPTDTQTLRLIKK